MHRVLSWAITTALSFLLSAVALAALPSDQDADVQYLFEFVTGSGCDFIRNGSAHNPQDAADHLRLKYSRGKRYISTAEEFIDKLATESSWSGKKYTIDCAGEITNAGTWLHNALDEHREGLRSERTSVHNG